MSGICSPRLLRALQDCKSLCILTGAGISAESGVSTFRGADGLRNKFKPEELANVNAFLNNPEMVWEWYAFRKSVIRDVRPNPGHEAIATMESLFPTCTLITQNVDGLHQRAGNRNVLELHGTIERSYCIACGKNANEDALNHATHVPRCEYCGGLVRPAVVWFGEMLPAGVFEEAQQAASWCDVFLSVGTSGVVYPAASLPIVARNAGAYVVEVNVEHTEASGMMHETILGQAGVVLPKLVEAIREERATRS